jgi:DNA-binding transcriptional MerR regulator
MTSIKLTMEGVIMKEGKRPTDVAAEFNRSTAWLRGLERRGIIPEPARDPLNNWRVYPPDAVEKIRETLKARANGKG